MLSDDQVEALRAIAVSTFEVPARVRIALAPVGPGI
jgi:hypothetical protein